jgi:hypothetical protein
METYSLTEYADCGLEIDRINTSGLKAKPVFINGIMQKTWKELIVPHDAIVGGNMVRIYAGTQIIFTSFGSSGSLGGQLSVSGNLTRNLYVKCKDGVTRILPSGATVEMIK